MVSFNATKEQQYDVQLLAIYAGATPACASWITALNHKVLHTEAVSVA